ncbi:poly(ADP-ribose) glycohydrolase domain-containing protein [Paenibacillus paeoniae]|uniref:DUF2263 domain-containing protein n=1 Tax=Paenibacillus paeoniae TaxID=2292705 RepID=A0A371P6M1_9BACL|nr:poly(ADP-ribose) glycohydrolase domain-containing protein [Paenibacillus paeoniae]REK71160.1 DUF2263 domain-containing protein [Paenibacillus paeoniae]
MNRNLAARVAEETLAILEEGQYRNARNETVDIGAALTHAIDGAVLYPTAETDNLLSTLTRELSGARFDTGGWGLSCTVRLTRPENTCMMKKSLNCKEGAK